MMIAVADNLIRKLAGRQKTKNVCNENERIMNNIRIN